MWVGLGFSKAEIKGDKKFYFKYRGKRECLNSTIDLSWKGTRLGQSCGTRAQGLLFTTAAGSCGCFVFVFAIFFEVNLVGKRNP